MMKEFVKKLDLLHEEFVFLYLENINFYSLEKIEIK